MILVVDDNKDLARMLQLALEQEGYRVETAADGALAYSHVKAPDCKAMLLDVHMPHINGVELLLLMQAEGIHVPTILMAGFDDFDEKEMKQFANVVKFMKKPFAVDEMVHAIRRYARPPHRKTAAGA
jgi:DNA-binding NtrC family response regulator